MLIYSHVSLVGSCSAALSYDEAIIIGRDENGPVPGGHHERVGLLESDGTWREVAWYPVKVGYCEAFAMNSNFVYAFGGVGEGFDRTYR